MSERCGEPTKKGTACEFPSATNCPHHHTQGLTDKQRRFVEEYTVDFNATQAAIRAGYSEHTARAIGSENLTKPDISAAIERRMDELAMTADEALLRLADWARANIGSCIEILPSGDYTLDLNKAKEQGKLHLIREVSYNSDGRPKVKLHDAMDAVKQIARVHGLFVDRVQHSGEIKGGDVHVYLPGNDRDDLPEQLRRRMAALSGNGPGGNGAGE